EPSTHTVFWETSDVWNRRANAPGKFNANDQPQSEDAQSGSGGSNFAFVRVRRNAKGTAEAVTARFLYADFGSRSHLQPAGAAPAPTIPSGAGELVKPLPAGYRWPLPADVSGHVCLAVEISTPKAPIAQPSLLGTAPGLGSGLMVLGDNNKAQRNLAAHYTA